MSRRIDVAMYRGHRYSTTVLTKKKKSAALSTTYFLPISGSILYVGSTTLTTLSDMSVLNSSVLPLSDLDEDMLLFGCSQVSGRGFRRVYTPVLYTVYNQSLIYVYM